MDKINVCNCANNAAVVFRCESLQVWKSRAARVFLSISGSRRKAARALGLTFRTFDFEPEKPEFVIVQKNHIKFYLIKKKEKNRKLGFLG